MASIIASEKSPYRRPGWAAIASGTLGILAFTALITAVFTRTTLMVSGQVLLFFTIHNAVVILQFLLMIPMVFALRRLSANKDRPMKQATLVTGVIALSCTVLFLILIFPEIMIDEYYMIPQASFGVWLVFVNWQLSGTLSKAIRWFGMVVGVGLLLVGIYAVGFAIFVDPTGFKIPAPDPNTLEDPGATTANIVVHIILDIGTFIGVLTLPVWTILLGRKLLREKK